MFVFIRTHKKYSVTIYNLCVPIVLLHFCFIIGKVVSSVVTRKVAKTTDVPSGIYFFKSIVCSSVICVYAY